MPFKSMRRATFPLIFGLFLTSMPLFSQTATPPAIGDGGEGTPYQIATLDNLYWLSQNSTEWGKYFIQTTDINASSTSGWDGGAGFSPIGESGNAFTGSYDGNNKTISGLFINRPSTQFIGLFGSLNGATIDILGVTNADITGASPTGILAGDAYICTISDCYTTGTVVGTYTTGGLLGTCNSGTTANCYSTASVTVINHTGGGLLGYASGGTVNTCYSTGSASGGTLIGGLIGRSQAITINNCYSRAGVSGSSTVGGLIGEADVYSLVNYCYSAGSLSIGTNVGGLMGLKDKSTVTVSFWDTEASGQSSSPGGTGKTTAEMKNHRTFTDVAWSTGLSTAWDFETNPYDDAASNNYWDMDYSAPKINEGYPYLSWQDGDAVSLPVELTSFSAEIIHDGILIKWTTESETNNLGYILER
ncbi:hypothetical protein HQ585_04300, partial [candidate division KSB1 bacterium]|nr:hypothetical protein [candidate division KSB1 bacterium]